MRILTVLRQVPDSNAKIKIAADSKSIDTNGLKLLLNPFAEFAAEQAVQLREQGQAVDDIVALTIGSDKCAEVLRVALAMGADRGIHLNDQRFTTHDELYLAAVVASAIKQQDSPFDLILCGKQDIDNDAGELGPALAEHLQIPHVGAVVGLEMKDDTLKTRRRVEGAEEHMSCSLPCLITCEKGLVEPRYPSLPNLMKAKKKPVETISAEQLSGLADIPAPGSELLTLTPPAERGACQLVEGEPQQMAQELVRLLREEAKVI